MNTLITFIKDEKTPMILWSNQEIKETNKLIVTSERRFKKDNMYIYIITTENLSEQCKQKCFFILDGLYYYGKVALNNGEILEYNKKKNEYIIDDELISYGEMIDIVRSEIGLKVV